MGGCMSSPKELAKEGEAPVEIPTSPKTFEAEPPVQENKGEAKGDEVEKKEEALVESSDVAAAEEAKPEEAEAEAKKEEAKPVEAARVVVESDKSDAPLVTL